MSVSALSYLRSLASVPERLDRSDVTHSASVQEQSPLLTLVRDTLSTGPCSHSPRGAGLPRLWRSPNLRSWSLPYPDKVYAIRLVKKRILTKFQVFCSAKTIALTDLHQRFREFAEASELFNCKVVSVFYHTHHSPSKKPPNKTQISFEDFVEVFVSSHSECVSESILESSEVKDISETARQEALFIKSLVSTFNAHSSLLHRLCVCHEDSHTTTNPDTHRGSPYHSTTDDVSEKAALKRIEVLIASELWKEIALHLRYAINSKSQLQAIMDIMKSAIPDLKRDKGNYKLTIS